MSFRKLITAGVLAALSATAAQAATIIGYDIRNASGSGTLGQRFTYTGTISPSAEGVPGTFDLLGGTGSLADGIVPTTVNGLNPFNGFSSSNASITLFFDSFIRVGAIDLFGLNRLSNGFGGAISEVTVTVADFQSTFATLGFGPENRVGRLIHDRVDLDGSFLSRFETDRITLSNFQTDGVFFGDTFTLGEITVTEAQVAPVPLPASGLLMVAGIGGLMAARRRKKAS